MRAALVLGGLVLLATFVATLGRPPIGGEGVAPPPGARPAPQTARPALAETPQADRKDATGAPRPKDSARAAAPREPGLPEEEIDADRFADTAALLAEIELPADAPLALPIGRVGPPDPLETGEASLHLTLFDERMGEPVASPVVLWRLDAPANEYWTEGDQAVAFEHVPETGRAFTRLTAGDYRAVCMAERRGAPDPPEFHVAGSAEHALFLALPGERRVRVRLLAGSERVELAELQLDPIQSSAVAPAAPVWVEQRRMRAPVDGVLVDEAFESLDALDPGPWVRVASGIDGFDLGTLPEDRRDRAHLRLARFRTRAGRAEIVVRNPVRHPRTAVPPLRQLDVLRFVARLEER